MFFDNIEMFYTNILENMTNKLIVLQQTNFSSICREADFILLGNNNKTNKLDINNKLCENIAKNINKMYSKDYNPFLVNTNNTTSDKNNNSYLNMDNINNRSISPNIGKNITIIGNANSLNNPNAKIKIVGFGQKKVKNKRNKILFE